MQGRTVHVPFAPFVLPSLDPPAHYPPPLLPPRPHVLQRAHLADRLLRRAAPREHVVLELLGARLDLRRPRELVLRDAELPVLGAQLVGDRARLVREPVVLELGGARLGLEARDLLAEVGLARAELGDLLLEAVDLARQVGGAGVGLALVGAQRRELLGGGAGLALGLERALLEARDLGGRRLQHALLGGGRRLERGRLLARGVELAVARADLVLEPVRVWVGGGGGCCARGGQRKEGVAEWATRQPRPHSVRAQRCARCCCCWTTALCRRLRRQHTRPQALSRRCAGCRRWMLCSLPLPVCSLPPSTNAQNALGEFKRRAASRRRLGASRSRRAADGRHDVCVCLFADWLQGSLYVFFVC